MAVPIIRSNGTVSGAVVGTGRSNAVVGETVYLTDTQPDNVGVLHAWVLEDVPIGSGAVIAGPASETASFVVDKPGSYRVRLTVGGISVRVIIGAPLPITGSRIPSYLEEAWFDGEGNVKGWHTAMSHFMSEVDTRLGLTSFPGYGLSANISTIGVGDLAGSGALATVARADHRHALPAPTTIEDISASASTLGVSAKVAREDHRHFHGNLSGGALHALATVGAAGFMAAGDKAADFITTTAQPSLPNSRRILAGTNITIDLTVAGQLTINATGGGGGGGPTNVPYWVGAPDVTLSAEHNLGGLATGLVKNTAGTPSIAVADTDYTTPTGMTTYVTAQLAGYVPVTRTISTTSGLAGGGALSSNLTLSIAAGGVTGTHLENLSPNPAGTANYATVTVDAKGRVTAATTPTLLSFTVLGSSGGGAPEAIRALDDGGVLRRTGGALAFGTLPALAFADGTIAGSRLTGFTNTAVAVGTAGGGLASLANGTDGYVLTMVAGAPAWAAAAGGGGGTITGGGTAGQVTYWSGASAITGSAGFTIGSNTLTLSAAVAGSAVGINLANTDNTSTASHARLDISVGGTAGGDPRLSFTVPSGYKWYWQVANSESRDPFYLMFDVGATTAAKILTFLPQVSNIAGALMGVNVTGTTPSHALEVWERPGDNAVGIMARGSPGNNNAVQRFILRAGDTSKQAYFASMSTNPASQGTLGGESTANRWGLYDEPSAPYNGMFIATTTATAIKVITADVIRTTWESNGNIGFGAGTMSYGGGVGVMFWKDATTAPTTNPAAGYISWSGSGRPSFKDSRGLTTVV